MKIGGGKAKGSAFEREVGYTLSKWITNGERDDLFARTVLSGGQFTVSQRGNPGDLMAQDPLAQRFCNLFVIECKHWGDLYMEAFVLQREKLYEALKKLDNDAYTLNKNWLFVVKQNFLPALVMTPEMPYHGVDWTRMEFFGIQKFVVVPLKKYCQLRFDLVCGS